MKNCFGGTYLTPLIARVISDSFCVCFMGLVSAGVVEDNGFDVSRIQLG